MEDVYKGIRVLVVSDAAYVDGTVRSIANLMSSLTSLQVSVTLAALGSTDVGRWWAAHYGPVAPVGSVEPVCTDVRRRQKRNAVVISQSRSTAKLVRAAIATVLGGIQLCIYTLQLAKEIMPYARNSDVLHSNNIRVHPAMVFIGKLTGTPVVIELHDILREGLPRKLLGALVMAADASICVSVAVHQQLPLAARRRAVVVTQSVEIERFPLREARLPQDPPRFATLSRLDPVKGVDTAIEAVRELRFRGIRVRLDIYGGPGTDGGAHEKYLRELASTEPDIVFRGPTNEVAATLSGVDVLLCPSHNEPFGLVALEAQAVGVPVIASDRGGHRDYLRDGCNALLVEPCNSSELARSMAHLVSSRELYNSLVRSGRLTALACDASVRGAEIASIYRRVLKEMA